MSNDKSKAQQEWSDLIYAEADKHETVVAKATNEYPYSGSEANYASSAFIIGAHFALDNLDKVPQVIELLGSLKKIEVLLLEGMEDPETHVLCENIVATLDEALTQLENKLRE